MIRTLNENKSYNPIRSHIKVNFSSVKDYEEKIELIADDLIKNQFDSNKSRVLIFVSSKQKAEDAVEDLTKILKDKNMPYWDKVDFYHAGLEGAEREEKFNSYGKYGNGEIVILIATKAFGMGMDIPNVHYVYHLDPSSNFEDFLQEVGRAGRDEQANLDAGFSEKNPIKTNCIIATDDFKNSKDRLHKKQTTWNHIIQVQKTIYEYVNKFSEKKVTKDEAFALPTDLLDQYSEYKGQEFDETFFRVILYWLEKLKKIKLATYTPTHIPLTVLSGSENYSIIRNADDVDKLKNLLSKINIADNSRLDEKGCYLIEMEELKVFLGVYNIREAWRLLFLAQKARAIKVEREIVIEPTLTRKNELEKWADNKISPIIESVFAFATRIMYASKFNQQTHLEGDVLDTLGNEAMQEHIIPSNVYWKEYFKKSNKERSPENVAKNLRYDFVKKRAKVSFKLISFLPEGKQKSILEVEKGYEKPKITQLVFNGYKNNKDWELFFQNFKKDLYALIKYVHDEYINSDVQKFNIVDLLIKLNVDEKGEDYFKQLIYVAKGLGFLKGNKGGLIPMGIELFILDETLINNDNLNEFEKKVQLEFQESVRMKELRLLSLECLATSVKIDKYDEYIKSYFQCATETDLVKLLEEHFGENHEALEAFRAEALEKEIKSLNDKQKKVYNASLKENLQVIAGPGSGKTHTLILRIARLIQDEKINPENILVLAYNRAVVVELKDRLNKLFRKLGYAKLIKRLKVFTFHGFCKNVLESNLEELDFDHWTTEFLKVAKDSPGRITQKLGLINYVFVDEFQDITKERLELLKFIAKSDETKICVIGDPNQSIYGYVRVKEGGQMSPKPYYEAFNEVFKPKELYLSINRRSYPQILEEANKLLSFNKLKFENMPSMEAFHKYDGSTPVCEFYDLEKDKTKWKDKLEEMVEFKSEIGEHYKDIAIMFRSNIEVYRAFNEIRKSNLPDVRIRVQGASGSLNKTREFHYFLKIIKGKSEEKLSLDYFIFLKDLKSPLLNELPNWNEYLIDIFLCIAFEFSKEMNEDSTYDDLFDFIQDISSKDDGQFGKLYQQNIHKISNDKPKKEIVLTTMHKVKGIEYDAVLIPSSISNFAMNSNADSIPNIDDVFEEERRLYYVAYTRAKYKLVVIKWKKENALYNTNPEPVEIFRPEDLVEKLGVLMNEGIDKFILYFGASIYGRSSFNTIKTHISLGDKVTLKRRQVENAGIENVFWDVHVKNAVVAQLSSNITKKLKDMEDIDGFFVSAIYVHTYEETKNSDEDWVLRGKPVNERGRPYADKWATESKERGYIYLIDFSGYGKKIKKDDI